MAPQGSHWRTAKPGASRRLRQLPPARVEGKFELEIIFLRLKLASKGGERERGGGVIRWAGPREWEWRRHWWSGHQAQNTMWNDMWQSAGGGHNQRAGRWLRTENK